jgi:phosphatidate cytidylyltransferase
MISTRVLVGSILALAAAGVLFGDSYLVPWFPCFFSVLMLAGVLTSRELLRLFPAAYRPRGVLVTSGVLLCLAANWYPNLLTLPWYTDYGEGLVPKMAAERAFSAVMLCFTLVMLGAFLVEMYLYREPGTAIPRIGATLLAVSYLGILPSFFAQIRLHPSANSGLLLALTVCVPKCNDIAAFFTGTFFGRHKMTPLLSPKKTWEGFCGGAGGSILAAVGLSFLADAGRPVFPAGVAEAAAFGLIVGIAGVLGDLAESMLKRDGYTKDASKSIPGFGGLLDVVDSVLFAAPVAYLWFSHRGS